MRNKRAIISRYSTDLKFLKSAHNKIVDEHVSFHTSSKMYEEKDKHFNQYKYYQQAEMRILCCDRMA